MVGWTVAGRVDSVPTAPEKTIYWGKAVLQEDPTPRGPRRGRPYSLRAKLVNEQRGVEGLCSWDSETWCPTLPELSRLHPPDEPQKAGRLDRDLGCPCLPLPAGTLGTITVPCDHKGLVTPNAGPGDARVPSFWKLFISFSPQLSLLFSGTHARYRAPGVPSVPFPSPPTSFTFPIPQIPSLTTPHLPLVQNAEARDRR